MLDPRLKDVLASYPSMAQPSSPPEFLGNSGGGSGSRLWRFPSEMGLLLARAWPPNGPDRGAIARIHRWLGETRSLGFVPIPISGLDGETLRTSSGLIWELSPWMPGRAEILAAPRIGQVVAGFEALAAFHLALHSHRGRAPSPGLNSRMRELEWLRGEGFSLFDRKLMTRDRDPVRSLGMRWIQRAQALAPELDALVRRSRGQVVTIQPCLRDARPDHFLFTEERLTGLVDFGAMGIDSVATDLARLMSEWLGQDHSLRASALDAYRARSSLPDATAALIPAFEMSAAILGGSHWLRWHLLEGRRFDDPIAVETGLLKSLERLDEQDSPRFRLES